MAATAITMNTATPLANAVSNFLRQARTARDGLRDQLAIMQTMINGDGSAIAQFDLVVQAGGYGGWVASNAVTDAQRTQAKASWDELNSLYAKMSAQTGDVTGIAITQACAKHGV